MPWPQGRAVARQQLVVYADCIILCDFSVLVLVLGYLIVHLEVPVQIAMTWIVIVQTQLQKEFPFGSALDKY